MHYSFNDSASLIPVNLFLKNLRFQNFREVLLNPCCHIRLVHGIDMDVFYAVRQQVYDLIGGIGDARLFHGFRIVTEAIYDIFKAFWNVTAGQFYRIFHLHTAGNWHDAGNDGHGNPRFPHTVHKVEEDIVIEEHLGRQIFAPGIHLCL